MNSKALYHSLIQFSCHTVVLCKVNVLLNNENKIYKIYRATRFYLVALNLIINL